MSIEYQYEYQHFRAILILYTYTSYSIAHFVNNRSFVLADAYPSHSQRPKTLLHATYTFSKPIVGQ